MAVKARASVTIVKQRDIDACYWFYKLQSAMGTPPTKGTMVLPSQKGQPPTDTSGTAGTWTDSEPAYTAGDTRILYVVELTYFTDGTAEFSEVSVDSSYEAAMQAYELAHQADEKADENSVSINGKEYYQYTTGGYTYDVWEEDGHYYYYNSGGVKTEVSYANLDMVDGEPVKVLREGLNDKVKDAQDTADSTHEAIYGEGGIQKQLSDLNSAVVINHSKPSVFVGTKGTYIDPDTHQETEYVKAGVEILETGIDFLKDDERVAYIDTSTNESVLDIRSTRIHNSLRIGELEIVEFNGGIGVRRI